MQKAVYNSSANKLPGNIFFEFKFMIVAYCVLKQWTKIHNIKPGLTRDKSYQLS